MIPHVAPPVWPDIPQMKHGRLAASILRNSLDLRDDPQADDAIRKCRIGLIGLADDEGVQLNNGRPGAGQGPHAFRAALARYGVASPMCFTGENGKNTGGAYPRIFDAGDIVPGESLTDTHNRVTEAALALLELGLFPVAVGGGHDLTFPFVRAVARVFGPLHGVYFDAHLDVRAEPGSGMPFRALAEGGLATGLTCVGVNPFVNTREHFEAFASFGGRAETQPLPVAPLQGNPFTGPRQFVSLDLDVFDSAFAPGVSALNPCGLSPREVEPSIYAAGQSAAVKCFDIMELNPLHDVEGRTARLAAHMFLTFLRGFAERGE